MTTPTLFRDVTTGHEPEIPELPSFPDAKSLGYVYLDCHRPLTPEELRYRMRDDPDPRCQPGPDWTADEAHAQAKALSRDELRSRYLDGMAWRGYKRYLKMCEETGMTPRYAYKGNGVHERL